LLRLHFSTDYHGQVFWAVELLVVVFYLLIKFNSLTRQILQGLYKYLDVVSRFPEVFHDTTRLGGISAVRIEGSQHAQVAQRLTGVLSALHFAIDNASVPSFAGDVVHFGYEPLVL